MHATYDDGGPRRLEFAEWFEASVAAGELEGLDVASMSLAEELYAGLYRQYLDEHSLAMRDYVIAAIRRHTNTIRFAKTTGAL